MGLTYGISPVRRNLLPYKRTPLCLKRHWFATSFCAFSCLLLAGVKCESVITTVVGGVGDGGPSFAARLRSPTSVFATTKTSSGGVVLYIADRDNHRIRRVDGDGNITSVAGTGTAAFRGDGGSAVEAGLSSPCDVSVFSNSSTGGVVLFIADMMNHRIRRVNEHGAITSVVGTAAGFFGDGGFASASMLNRPHSVTTLTNSSSGGMMMFITDMYNHRIRCVDDGGIISTKAGNGTFGFSGDGGAAEAAMLNYPRGVSVVFNASSGGVVLYIADTNNNRIRRIDESGIITTVSGTGVGGFSGDGGSATSAIVRRPWNVFAVTNVSTGSVVLYIADTDNHRIRRVAETGNISSMAGPGVGNVIGDGGAATAAKLVYPTYVFATFNESSNGTVLYIADTNNHRIRRVDEIGNISTEAGPGLGSSIGDGSAATAAELRTPWGVAAVYNASSNGVLLYIVDFFNQCVRHVNESGIISSVVGSVPWGFSGDGGAAAAARLHDPTRLSTLFNASSGGVTLFIADTHNHRIRRVDESGNITSVAGMNAIGFSGDGGLATAAMLWGPRSVSAVVNASSGAVVLYIADTRNQRIRRVDDSGIITSVAGDGTLGFGGDGGTATAARLRYPYDVSALYNSSSGGMVLYIADCENHRIRRVDDGGNITTVAGFGAGGFSGDGGPATSARLSLPTGVTALIKDSNDGVVLYIADTSNHRIRRVNNGLITTIAGIGSSGFTGDGGAATAARLHSPTSVSVLTSASSGGMVLYIADKDNHRIRRVTEAVSPSSSASATATRSPSPSGTCTSTATLSASVSATGSATTSATASSTASATASATASVTGSITASAPASAVPSASVSASGTFFSSATTIVSPSVRSNFVSEVLHCIVLLDA